MKKLLMLTLFSTLILPQIVSSRILEIDVHGMMCEFCVDRLEREFGSMKSVYKVNVILKRNKIFLETNTSCPRIETIEQTILEAGFTPLKITDLSKKKKQK